MVGKTTGHLYQSDFYREVMKIVDGPPPDVNLINEKNNGESILKLIDNNLINSAHDVSSGGIIVSLTEMAMSSLIGIKLEKPKKLSNIFEYFFGEDQGRYLIEIDKENLEKSKKILKENNVHYELIGITQKNNIELSGEMKINIKDLYQINNKWYYNY